MAPRILSVLCLLLVLQGSIAARVESGTNLYNMFMFGDSFADTGNGPASSNGRPTRLSRAWFDPYGCNYEDYNGNWQGFKPSGRFSDYMVQSDVIANIMGFHEAAPAYKQSNYFCDPYGMTFATVGAGVFETPDKAPTLGQQVDSFKGLMYDGFISSTRLDGAFVLVAISGNDYVPKINLLNNTSPTSIAPLTPYIENVTNEIVGNVHRLQKLGASKILVNNMHPLGCMPRHTRVNNYTRCEGHGNFIASAHNSMLQQKLGNDSSVHIVDLYTAFTKIINNQTPDSHRFTFKLAPTCEATDPKGFCGFRDNDMNHFYNLDEDHLLRHFYWDDMHPTSAGWKAVMKQLEGPIKSLLA